MLFVVLLVLHLKASQEEVILKICNMLVIEAINTCATNNGQMCRADFSEEKQLLKIDLRRGHNRCLHV